MITCQQSGGCLLLGDNQLWVACQSWVGSKLATVVASAHLTDALFLFFLISLTHCPPPSSQFPLPSSGLAGRGPDHCSRQLFQLIPCRGILKYVRGGRCPPLLLRGRQISRRLLCLLTHQKSGFSLLLCLLGEEWQAHGLLMSSFYWTLKNTKYNARGQTANFKQWNTPWLLCVSFLRKQSHILEQDK